MPNETKWNETKNEEVDEEGDEEMFYNLDLCAQLETKI